MEWVKCFNNSIILIYLGNLANKIKNLSIQNIVDFIQC